MLRQTFYSVNSILVNKLVNKKTKLQIHIPSKKLKRHHPRVFSDFLQVLGYLVLL